MGPSSARSLESRQTDMNSLRKWSIRVWILVGLAAAMVTASCAGTAPRPAALHSSFASGFVTTSLGTWSTAAAVRVQRDGYIVTAGEKEAAGREQISVARYTSGGRLDNKFGKHGIVTTSIGPVAGIDSGAALALQRDGNIVIAGSGTIAGRLAFAAVRLTRSGALDQSFARGGIATIPIGTSSIANAVIIDPSGDILLGGVATVNGGKRFAVARLLPDGSLDPSFGIHGVSLLGQPDAGAWGMARQRNGRLVLAGWRTVDGRTVYMAAGATPNGTPDEGFGTNGVVTIPIGSAARADAIVRQPNGELVMTGDATVGGARTVATVRLRADGSIDRTFGSDGITAFSKGWGVNAIAVDSAGHILLAGGGPNLVALAPNGTFDRTLTGGGSSLHGVGAGASANGVAAEPDGHFVLAGATQLDGRIQQLLVRVKG